MSVQIMRVTARKGTGYHHQLFCLSRTVQNPLFGAHYQQVSRSAAPRQNIAFLCAT